MMAPRSKPSLLDVTIRNAIAIVVLNRPDLHNAFNESLIAELTSTLTVLDNDDAIRAIVLAGAGKSFCAGADLNWMKKMATYSHDDNLADATALAQMLRTLAGLAKPTIARVHGAAMGGGAGLVACCDIAIAAQEATFAFSECKALVRGVAHRPIDADVIAGTAEHIAAVRASPEGRAGIKSFLDKRAAPWVPSEPMKPTS